MRSSISALLLLLIGVVAGIGLGFVLGSGATPALAADPATSSIARSPSGALPPAQRSDDGVSLALAGPRSALLTGAASADLTDVEVAHASATAARSVAAVKVVGESASDAGGDGVIIGHVLDAQGAPLPGADVVVERSGSPRRAFVDGASTDGIGRAWSGQGTLGDEVDEFAKERMTSRRGVVAVKTDAAGAFRLEGLVPGQHRLRAYAEGYVLDSENVQTGDSVRFVARPVGEFHLAVRLPDGSEPARAVVLTIDDDGDETSYAWTPAEPVIRLSRRTRKLRALGGTVERARSDRFAARLASEERRVDLDRDGPGPHVFDLAPASVLRVLVTDESEVRPRISPWVKLKDLASDETKSLSCYADGPFLLADPKPGTYELTAGRGQVEAEWTESVEIVGGVNEVAVTLGDVDLAQYLVVHCSDDAGRPVLDARFRYSVKSEDGSSSGGMRHTSPSPGEYWLARSRFRPEDGAVAATETKVTVQSGEHGKLERKIDPDQGELHVVFEPQCELRVAVTGHGDRSLRVVVEPRSDADSNRGWRSYSNAKAIDADGTADMGTLQPGPVRVLLMRGEGQHVWGLPVAELDVTLPSGPHSVTLVAPEMYDLVVHAPGCKKGDHFNLQLQSLDGEGQWIGGTELDESLRARFEGLAAGSYVLNAWGSEQGQMEVTVPSGEITFEPIAINAVRVSGLKEGKAFARAGFRNGDVITHVGEHAIAGAQYFNRISLALVDGDVTFEVLRSGKVVQVVVSKIPTALDVWEALGCQLHPTHYP